MPKIQYKEINFRGKSLDLINLVNQVINEYKNQGYELTLRQTYYQLVARGYIPNNERTLIIKGKKTFADVPDRIKDKVKEVLVDLDCPELAE